MLKRLFDLVAAGLGLAILSPLFLIVAVANSVASPGPVFYRATRVGRHGRLFQLYKFRSMVADADQIGPGITAAQDTRITPMGRILRRYKLDELPQLINVLKGEMSLVGPRPEDPRYVALYTPEQRRVLDVRPGITSPASVRYRHEAAMLVGDGWETKYIEEVMPAKLAIDLEYAQNASFGHDMGILFQTFLSLWR